MKTCKLPLGQYSVRITGCGESRQAPTNLQMFWWLKSLHWCKDERGKEIQGFLIISIIV